MSLNCLEPRRCSRGSGGRDKTAAVNRPIHRCRNHRKFRSTRFSSLRQLPTTWTN